MVIAVAETLSFFCIVDYCFKEIVTLMFIMIVVTIYTRERDLSWNSPLNRMQFSYILIRFGARAACLERRRGLIAGHHSLMPLKRFTNGTQ